MRLSFNPVSTRIGTVCDAEPLLRKEEDLLFLVVVVVIGWCRNEQLL